MTGGVAVEARRSAVREWYRATTGPALPPPAAGDGDLVVAFPGAEEVGAGLAASLGRPLVALPGVDALVAAIGRDEPDSVLLLAPSPALPWRELSRLHEAAAATATLWGVLPFDEPGQLAFWAEKTLLAQRSTRTAGAAIDAITERAGRGGEPLEFGRDTVAAVLGGEWRLLTMVTHGDGQHLNLGTGVLCSLPGGAERVGDIELAGCSGPGETCRRSRPGWDLVTATSLRAEVLSLLSCSSFSVTGDVYPSDVNLLSTLADSYPAAVVTSPIRVRYARDATAIHEAELRAGRSLGEVTARRTGVIAAYEDTPWLTLVGDPLWRPFPVAEPPRRQPAEGAVRRAAIRPTGPPPESPVAALHRRVNAFESAVRLSPLPDDAREVLERLTATRVELERLLYGGGLDAAPDRAAAVVSGVVAAWDTTAAALVAVTGRTSPGTVDTWGGRFHHPRPLPSPGPCARCGGRLHARAWVSSFGGSPRRTVDCPLCGPVADGVTGVLDLRLPPLPVHEPGESFDAPVHLAADGGTPGRVTAAVVFGDGASPECWAAGPLEVDLAGGHAAVRMTAPASYRAGNPETRVVAFRKGEVAFAFGRAPLVVPATTPVDAP